MADARTKPDSTGSATLRAVTRRHFFEQAYFGLGGLALASRASHRLVSLSADT